MNFNDIYRYMKKNVMLKDMHDKFLKFNEKSQNTDRSRSKETAQEYSKN